MRAVPERSRERERGMRSRRSENERGDARKNINDSRERNVGRATEKFEIRTPNTDTL